MAMAASAADVIKMPFPAFESVSDGRGRKIPVRSLQLRSGNRASQMFTSLQLLPRTRNLRVVSCLASPPFSKTTFNPSTKLFVSGLSFRTTEKSLQNAFKNFGQLLEVNLVMDKIANRPKGFAFIRYATEEESQKAIEGMHGKVLFKACHFIKFLDGRVIFVEVAKSKSELRQSLKPDRRQN